MELPIGTQSFLDQLGLVAPKAPPSPHPDTGSQGQIPTTGDWVLTDCTPLPGEGGMSAAECPPCATQGRPPPSTLQSPSCPTLLEAGTRFLAQPQPLLLFLGAPRRVSGASVVGVLWRDGTPGWDVPAAGMG